MGTVVSPELFRSRLNEAMRWYSLAGSLKQPNAFWSSELKPIRALGDLNYRQRADLVGEVCDKRARVLRQLGTNERGASWGGQGTLLLYDPDQNLFDGAAQEITRGYFDVDNVPPWDTWVAYVVERPRKRAYDSYLVSWIPKQHLELVAKGLWANPEQCLSWADDIDPASLLGPLWRESGRNRGTSGQ
jgi:hypothetical protein